VTEQEWVEFLATGIPQSVSVTRIPVDLSRALNCSTQSVQMHHAYAVKAYSKHGIDPYQMAARRPLAVAPALLTALQPSDNLVVNAMHRGSQGACQ